MEAKESVRNNMQLTDYLDESALNVLEKTRKKRSNVLHQKIVHHMAEVIRLVLQQKQSDIIRVSDVYAYIFSTLEHLEHQGECHLHYHQKEIHKGPRARS